MLVATGEAADLALGAGVDLKTLDCRADALVFFLRRDDAPGLQAGKQRDGNVLADRALHEERVGAVAGYKGQAGGDGVGGVGECHGFAVDLNGAGTGAALAGQDVEKLILALTFKGDDAENLTAVEVKRDVGETRAGGKALNLEAWGGGGVGGTAGGAGSGGGACAEHHLDDGFFDPRFDLHVTDGDAFAQHGGALADRGDLGKAVGDVDDGAAGVGLGADGCEHAVDEVGRESGGHLVEEEDVGFDSEGAGEVEDAEACQGEAADQRVLAEGGQAELADPVAEAVDWCAAEAEIVGDGKVGDQRGFLVDRHKAGAARACGGGDGAVLATNTDMAGIGFQRAGKDLDKGGLARPVRAHQGDDLAGSDLQRRIAQRHDRAEAFRDACCVKQGGWRGVCHGNLVEMRPPTPGRGPVWSEAQITRPGLCRR